jgi:acyl dehydratase
MTELTSPPGLLGAYARALLPKPAPGSASKPVPGSAPAAGSGRPEPRLRLRDRPVDRRRLARYRELCGFPADSGALPVTYPHLEAFPLSMALMARRDFPLPLLGLVHIGNTVQRLRPIGPEERLDYQVTVAAPRPHPKGTSVEVTAEASAGSGAVAWRSVSTYLRRGSRPGDAAAAAGPAGRKPAEPDPVVPDPVVPDLDEDWRLPSGLGRAYAAVSGDRNPIHLHPLTARLFGFPRHIAHGMWTKARCLAALEGAGLLPEGPYEARVEFRAPVLLPAHVRLRADAEGFRLTGTGDRPRPHLRGTIGRPGAGAPARPGQAPSS